MNHYTPHTQKISLKIVGFTNLALLGKRTILKVYTSKEQMIENENKAIQAERSIYNETKQFAKDFAASMYGMALKAKFWAAKKALRVKGYCWSRYIDLCNAFRLLRLFNNSICFDLRVKL